MCSTSIEHVTCIFKKICLLFSLSFGKYSQICYKNWGNTSTWFSSMFFTLTVIPFLFTSAISSSSLLCLTMSVAPSTYLIILHVSWSIFWQETVLDSKMLSKKLKQVLQGLAWRLSESWRKMITPVVKICMKPLMNQITLLSQIL